MTEYNSKKNEKEEKGKGRRKGKSEKTGGRVRRDVEKNDERRGQNKYDSKKKNDEEEK